MLCEKCRSSNDDGAKYCAHCGAPLAEPLHVAPSYGDGYNGAAQPAANRHTPPVIPPYAPYATPPAPLTPPKPARSTGAVVFYILSGLLALGCLVLPLLPHIGWYGNRGRTYGALEYAIKLIDKSSMFHAGPSGQLTGILILIMFMLPMFFQLLWAIFSFVRIGAAGGMGLVGSILYTNIGAYWILYLWNVVPIGGTQFLGGSTLSAEWLTVVPYLAVVLGVTGIIFSSIQLAQRRRVR